MWSRGGTRQCLPDQGELQLPEAAKSSGFTALRNKLDAKRKGHAGVGNAGAEAPRERLCRRLPSCSPTQDMPGDRPAALAQFSGTICYFGNTLPVPGALLTPSPRADPPALVPKCQGKRNDGRDPGDYQAPSRPPSQLASNQLFIPQMKSSQKHHTGKYFTHSPNFPIKMGNETIPTLAEVTASSHCSFLSLLLQCSSPSLCCEETPTGFVLGQPIPRKASERCLPPEDKTRAGEESRQKHITKKSQ